MHTKLVYQNSPTRPVRFYQNVRLLRFRCNIMDLVLDKTLHTCWAIFHIHDCFLCLRNSYIICQILFPEKVNAYVIFISTDYVFDGTSPPYQPTAQTCPLNKYGVSKAEGEQIVIKSDSGM